MSNAELNRRDFLRSAVLAGAALPLLMSCRTESHAQKVASGLDAIRKNAVTSCDNWCGAAGAPDSVTWKTALAKDGDEGERMIISGTVFAADGKTPAPNTLIYLYHTDVHGIYGRDSEHQHGRFRGWLLTDAQGKYEFSSIRPASYPNSTIPQHVHMTVTTKDRKEDWIDETWFADDKFVTAQARRSLTGKGGFNPVLAMEKGANGIWRGVRDIKL